MPSKKGLNRIDHEDLSLKIHTTESTSRRRSKWQNKAHLDGRIPKAVPGDPIAAADVHRKKAVQYHDNKRARRIKSFRDELPPPFNELDDVDPNLAIFIPVEDSGAVAVLRELEGSRALHKLREAIHEAHWWFGEDGTVGWVIALRQLPGGDLEVFADNAQHRDALQKNSAWETVFLDNLVEEIRRCGVSPRGLSVASVPKFPSDDQKTLLIQQLYDWNKSRIIRLGALEAVLSIEVRETNRGNPIVVVNLAQPEVANEFIAKGIQWGESTYVGRKYYEDWSLLQCEDCHSFGHTSISCTEGLRCNRCGQRHSQRDCKCTELECVNCGGLHRATERICPQRENEARRLRDLSNGRGRWWPSRNRTTDQDPKLRSFDPGSRSNNGNQMTEEQKPQKQGMMTTEVINTESPSSDAVNPGKPGVANIENSDGHAEQQLAEAISTAKRTEDNATSDPSIQNIIKMLHDSSKERELALHQQVENIKKTTAKAGRRARCKRQARQKKYANEQKAGATGTAAGEGNEVEVTSIVAPAAEGKRAEEVVNEEAEHKPSQAGSETDLKVFEPIKPQPMKPPQDREQESILGPLNSHNEQSAFAEKGILETPPTLPPLIRRFQSRNAVGGN
ncbi:MAG: hypothetical protein LQ349_007020 [Xanthoria aureola]|nr:MAG: hypothetical protein LQ349_007020 [Xanthoria aureola]